MTRITLACASLLTCCTRAPAPAPSDGPPVAPTVPAPAAASAGGESPAESPQAGGGEAMPTQLNSGTSSLAGCLASPGGTEQASRSRALPDPAQAKPELGVSAISGGVRVAHEISHACCLKSKIDTQVSGSNVTITETLTGTPCRCMCSSTVTTSVRLAPGDYALEVVLDVNGQKKTSGEQKITAK
jgi:hypothetical protein